MEFTLYCDSRFTEGFVGAVSNTTVLEGKKTDCWSRDRGSPAHLFLNPVLKTNAQAVNSSIELEEKNGNNNMALGFHPQGKGNNGGIHSF